MNTSANLFKYTSLVSRCFRSFSDVGILGIPISRGQTKFGVDGGPSIIRSSGLISELKEYVTVKDYGDLIFKEIKDDPNYGSTKNPRFIGHATEKVAQSVQNILGECKTCLNLGGDHSLGIGTVSGHAKVQEDIAVIWVDAHADLNTPPFSPTGNIHGMAASFFIKELKDHIIGTPGFNWLNPSINSNQIAYIGLRDVDSTEAKSLKELGIAAFSMKEVDKLGIYEVINRALEAVDPNNNRSIHVSFDIDSVDKCLVPSTGTSVIGGVSVREALSIAEELSATDRVRVLDLVEVNPKLGTERDVLATTEIALRIILGFFGKERGGNLPRDKS